MQNGKTIKTRKNVDFNVDIFNEYQGVKNLIYRLLFRGENIGYNPDDSGIDMAEMFGFIKVRNGNVYIANRIFETRLYNMFLMSTDE